MSFSQSAHVESMSVRVEDYLADKLQATTDLENIVDLLDRVRQQQTLLRKQLSEAKRALEDAQSAADEHALALSKETSRFQQAQAEIDRQLQSLTQSTVSNDAATIFESRMAKLRRIEVASGYLELLKEVDTLSNHAHSVVEEDAAAAIQDHARLRALLRGLHAIQPLAEDAAPHLIDHVQAKANALYDALKIVLERQLQSVLEQMSWPKRELIFTSSIIQDFQTDFEALLELQESTFDLNHASDQSTELSHAIMLLPLATMAKPFALRFQFHFYGDRPTNRLDKPEYFFSHVLDLVEQYRPFMSDILQPILDKRTIKFEQLEKIYPDAISAFITALLPHVRIKCISLVPQITTRPQLLSHFVNEMMTFDNSLRNTWGYTPVAGCFDEWKGITWDILTKHEYFGRWLEVEKDFALSRYRKIRDTPDSNVIDLEGVEAGRTKPTKGAIRVNDLLEAITNRYRALSSFSQKMKFLIDVQLAIFDDYHQHLHNALQAYLVGSHTAGRLIQGQSESETMGLKGLESLVKVFGSAEFLERKMSDWSDDVFFLELWDELQHRVQRTSRDGSVGHGLSVDEVAAKTSASIKNNSTGEHDDDEGGALFDETAVSYRRLREQAEVEINRMLSINVNRAFKQFANVSTWSSLSDTSVDPMTISPTASLDTLIQTLNALFGYLTRTMAPAPLRRFVRSVCQTVQQEVYDNVLMRHKFSSAGAAQLKRDVLALQDVLDSVTHASGESSRAMPKLEDALVLLNLPVREASIDTPDERDETNGWDFKDDDQKTEYEEGAGPDTPGFWEVEKTIFADNESARKTLADLQLANLTEHDAREVIKRRVEAAS